MRNAMIFAAGLGTRLRPLTDATPKALLPVAGVPLLRLLLDKLAAHGFDNIVVNAHHHASQIEAYLEGSKVQVSSEEQVLDTGGGLRQALPLFADTSPVLVHNVDILSDADLCGLYDAFSSCADDVLLLVSERSTTRYLLFDDDMRLVGWTNSTTGEVRSPYPSLAVAACHKYAFAGIHCLSPQVATVMDGYPLAFSLTAFYVAECQRLRIRGVVQDGLHLLDVGKHDTYHAAATFLRRLPADSYPLLQRQPS